MSTGTRRNRIQALAAASAFRGLFEDDDDTFWDRWQEGGSLRRKKDTVGDIEHVVIPRFGEVTTQNGLFSERKRVNLLWNRMDELVASGVLKKHLYGMSGFRYVEYGGILHEVFLADEKNWGAVLAIRTGPADLSQGIVTKFNRDGMYRQSEGYLRLVSTGEIVPVPDEETYFKLAGIRWTEPEDR